MKVKALSRSTASYQAPGSSVARQPRNLDPALHPLERAREYTRALNATKLERLFAKPFLGQLGRGHVDGVYTLAKDPQSLERLASGSGDGIVKVWDLQTHDEIWQAKAHQNFVRGLAWTHDRRLLTCGQVASRGGKTEPMIALYDPYSTADADSVAADPRSDSSSSIGTRRSTAHPVAHYAGKHAFTSLSHHRAAPVFAASHTAGVSIYDLSRPSSRPTTTLTWPTSVDTFTTAAFNPVETSILAAAATDRGIALFDLRTSSPLVKPINTLAFNSIAWNPMEAFNFAAANEDHNIYLFDSRNLSRHLNVFKDHVAAVMSVDFSPTGEELVSGSYDRTVRLWRRAEGHSRDVYHTKRMQRVFAVAYSPDNGYVLSGSDDGNVRLWRARASERRGVVSAAQRQSMEYNAALRKRYEHMPEIKRIARHRHVPMTVKKAGEIKREEVAALKRREENRRKHEAKSAGKEKRKSEREKMLLAVEK